MRWGYINIQWERCLMSLASAHETDTNPWIFYIFKDCLHCALIRNDQNPWAFLHQGRLITHLIETSDFFLCDLPLWILVILESQFIESDSQLCKTKYGWKRNLTSVYLQTVGLQVIFILFKAFSINFYNKQIVLYSEKAGPWNQYIKFCIYLQFSDG